MSIKSACVSFALILLPLLQSCAHDFGHISTPVSATSTKTQANAPAPRSAEQNAKSWWRTEQTLFAGPIIHSRGAAIFQYSRLHVQNTDIRIVLVDAVSANISLSCDGAFTLIAPGKTSAADARRTVSQDLAGDDAGRTNAHIILSDEVSTCHATFTFPNSRRDIKLMAFEPRHNDGANNDERTPSCVSPVNMPVPHRPARVS
jgi:hypothetical protein